MSVHRHTYRAYTGRVTPLSSRVLVMARYGLMEAWSSKITIGLFTFSMLPCVVSLVAIYFANNPLARALIGNAGSNLLEINASYFLRTMEVQSWLGLVMAAWVAPRLISFDLADNALPILLSHPISRVGYVMGKFIALAASLSVVTWVPCLLLYAYESYSSPLPWGRNHLMIANGLVMGAVVWIVFLSLLGLALSSWVKWRVVATGAIFAAVFVPAGVGAIVMAVLRTRWGLAMNIPYMMSAVWQRMLGAPEISVRGMALSNTAISMTLLAACLVCVAMLNKRIRAREVVRG